jgi:hypothetical protein
MKGYVIYAGRRYRVLNTWTNGYGALMARLKPFRGPEIAVNAINCTPWKRGSVRHINGTLPHRGKRPVHLRIDTAGEIISVHLKGTRQHLTCTFGGLYDMLARQTTINAKRDRAFAKRTRRRA